tara:strand:- start:712 stop:966 length:255 start_codon:yes stop_codon:yes gene_type:complete
MQNRIILNKGSLLYLVLNGLVNQEGFDVILNTNDKQKAVKTAKELSLKLNIKEYNVWEDDSDVVFSSESDSQWVEIRITKLNIV